MPRKKSSGLYSRKDSPYYWAQLWHHGKLLQVSTKCRDYEAARVWYANAERALAEGANGTTAKGPAVTETPLSEAFAKYLVINQRMWAPRWYETSKWVGETALIPFFGADRVVSDISDADAKAFHDSLLTRTKKLWKRAKKDGPVELVDTGQLIKPASINRIAAVTAKFGGWCVSQGFHTKNVFKDYPRMREVARQPPTLDPRAIEKWLQHVAPQWQTLATVALDTGLRRSELEKLKWTNIDWESGMAIIPFTKSGEPRTVALSRRVMTVLARLPRREDGHVFGPIASTGYRKAFTKAAKEVGLGHVWIHALRHWWATSFAQAGATMADLMSAGGWQTQVMPMRYTHSSIQRQREVMQRMEKNRLNQSELGSANPDQDEPVRIHYGSDEPTNPEIQLPDFSQ